jgi:hypothetical protein
VRVCVFVATNVHLGGTIGYSSVKSNFMWYNPPSQIVPGLPGIAIKDRDQ